jgi:4-amino-4-deoxy-L-arabinose transferase-like glycosyltransferase
MTLHVTSMRLSRATRVNAMILVLYGLVSYLLIVVWPPPWPDEVFFAEPARVLSETGNLSSNVILGMQGHVYWQPPGFFLFLAVVIRVVGFDLVALRMVSIFLGGLILLVVYGIARRITPRWEVASLAMGLLAINPNFVTYIKLVRMDGLCVLLQMTALLLVLGGKTQSRSRLFVVGALLAGAVMTHPLGAIGYFIVMYHLMHGSPLTLTRRWGDLCVMLIPLAVALVFYGLYVLQDLGAFESQMAMQFQRKVQTVWQSCCHFVVRYRSLPLFPVVVIAASIIWIRRRLWQSSAAHNTLAVGLCFATAIVAMTFILTYHVYLLPLASVALALTVEDIWRERSTPMMQGTIILLLLLAVNFIGHAGYLTNLYHRSSSAPLKCDELFMQVSAKLPQNSTVLLLGYPDGYWYLDKYRPDLMLSEGVAFSQKERLSLRSGCSHAVIGRAFEPRGDSIGLFADMKQLLLLDDIRDRYTILATFGESRMFFPSAWVIALKDSVSSDRSVH